MGRRVRYLIAAGALAASGIAVAATPGGAADTNTQFTITGGNLAITAPTSANLGSVPSGTTTLSGSLGTVTVSDTRNLFVATWTASVSSTNFTTGGGSASETVLNAAVGYTTGTATTTGSGSPGFVAVGAASLAAVGVAGTWVGTGNNSAAWNPTINVTLPPGQFAGTYTGVITHSVA